MFIGKNKVIIFAQTLGIAYSSNFRYRLEATSSFRKRYEIQSQLHIRLPRDVSDIFHYLIWRKADNSQWNCHSCGPSHPQHSWMAASSHSPLFCTRETLAPRHCYSLRLPDCPGKCHIQYRKKIINQEKALAIPHFTIDIIKQKPVTWKQTNHIISSTRYAFHHAILNPTNRYFCSFGKSIAITPARKLNIRLEQKEVWDYFKVSVPMYSIPNIIYIKQTLTIVIENFNTTIPGFLNYSS